MQTYNKIQSDFTVGNIPRKLLSFSIPFMLSNVMQLTYSLVDLLVVGRHVGTSGISAVNNAAQIVLFCTMFCLGFCTGGQVLISQLVGAKRHDQLSGTIGTIFTTILAMGGAFTLIILLLRNTVIRLIAIPIESKEMAFCYLTICGGGLLLSFGYNMVSAVLRGMGDSKRPFLFILIASVVNLALDILFTAVLGWGVAGAAAATVIGQGVSFLFAAQFLYRRREQFGFSFHLKDFIPNWSTLKVLASLGIPYAIQSCAVNISTLYVNRLVNLVDVSAAAAFGVGVKLDDIASKLTQGIMYAVSPMVGQNIGARKPERAAKTVWWALLFSTCLYIIFTVIYLSCSRQLFGIFDKSKEVQALAPVFVSAVVWGFPAMAIMRATGGFIQGMGCAKMSMILGMLDGVFCRMLLSYVLGIVLNLGFYGFVLGFSCASYVYAIPSFFYFLRGKWKKRKILIPETSNTPSNI